MFTGGRADTQIYCSFYDDMYFTQRREPPTQPPRSEFYADTNLPFPESSNQALVTWNMIVLILAVGLATVTSRVNYMLRRRAYEATELGQYVIQDKIG